MRGKVYFQRSETAANRITPAYAGKRNAWARRKSATRDHPRVCGEKGGELAVDTDEKGSPPRMRGKGVGVQKVAALVGITPAYAGKSAARW